jgi:hypothetical protein
VDAVRVGQAEAVAHSTPEGERIQPKLGYLSSGLRGNALRKVPEAGAPQAATAASDSARIRVGHEALRLVVVFLHDESECTLKLKTGHLHTVVDVEEVVIIRGYRHCWHLQCTGLQRR